MKRLMSFSAVLIMIMIILFGCNQKEPVINVQDVSSFSYDEVVASYLPDEAGVRTEGFHNQTKTSVANAQDAVELAEKECRITYDSVAVSRDETKKMWQVTFYTEGVVGGDLSVYLDDNGITQMTVAGE